jgi:signal transduction histidine kinase
MVTRTGRGIVWDIVLTAFLLLSGLGSLQRLGAWGPPARPADQVAVLLIVVAASSAALRRWPLLSFGIATAATSVYLALGYAYGPILLSVVIASYGIARRLRPRIALLAAAAGVPVMLTHLFVGGSAFDRLWGLLPGTAWIVVPFSIGLARRLAVESAERQRSAAERRALDEERLRLASEVHDIVGHGLAAIQMQADIARHMRERKPEQADIALDAISRASAEALAELRATLAAIAPEGATAHREALAPTPGLHRLADLCERMRESGVEVELAVVGRPTALPAAIDVASYRIAQESLTNVAKHAAARRASVRVTYAPTALEIEVVNPATPAGPVDEGFGISGMRRRAHDAGGGVSIAAENGEFRVAAVFPLDATR